MNHAKWGQILVVGLVLGLSGCATLNSVQKSELTSMKNSDTGVYVEEKNTTTATLLGLLPGGGSFYTRQWGLGVCDLLLWPFSVLWDPIAGNEGAKVINYDVSKARAKKVKLKEVAALESQIEAKEITEEEYRRKRSAIEARYMFD